MVITTHMADKIREYSKRPPDLDTKELNKISKQLEKSLLEILEN